MMSWQCPLLKCMFSSQTIVNAYEHYHKRNLHKEKDIKTRTEVEWKLKQHLLTQSVSNLHALQFCQPYMYV